MGLILGIDPGSRITGYGVIESGRQGETYVASGSIRTQGDSFPDRLAQIFSALGTVIEKHHPDVVAVEKAFMARNADSALKLGQARGASIAAAASFSLPVYEYAARAVKQSVVGRGGADKSQVQHMICKMLRLRGVPGPDAADALAIAMCHAHHQRAHVATRGAAGSGA